MNRVTITFLLLLVSCLSCGGAESAPSASMVPAPPLAAASSSSPSPPAAPESPTLLALRECARGKTDDATNRATGEAIREASEQIAANAPDKKALMLAVWDCFVAFKASKAKTIRLVQDIHKAISDIKDPSYAPKAVALLEKPIVDPHDPVEAMDEIQFHQATAVRLIGDLKYTAGVRPLINVLLTKEKRDLVYSVRLALLKMPKDSEPLLIRALDRSDPDFAKRLAADSVPLLTEALAEISRPKGQAAIIDALANADNDETRAILTLALTQFPKTDASTKAFFAGYAKVKSGTVVRALGGANARAILTSGVAQLFDGAHVDFLLNEVATAKGDEKDALPPNALSAAIKLMTNANSTAVGNAVKKIPGAASEKDLYAAALKPLDQCKKDPRCYVKFITQTPLPTAPPPSAKMGHIKAVWMIGMLATDSASIEFAKNTLLTHLESVEDGSMRTAIVEVLAHLSPKGDETTAKALEQIVEAATAEGNKGGVDEMYRTALKLRSRLE